jgi:hypothetical protein
LVWLPTLTLPYAIGFGPETVALPEVKGEFSTSQSTRVGRDFKTLIKCSTQAQHQTIHVANQIGNSSFDQSFATRCRDFVKKYDISVQ